MFVHCGVLSVGVRKKLGLPSPFDLRLGDPLAVAALALRFPSVPVIIPHFGAGLFREALMAADQCPNIHLDTSSSNSWMKYHPGLTLEGVFRQALTAIGPGPAAVRHRFVVLSPRVADPRSSTRKSAALDAVGVNADDRAKILGGNFERLFPHVLEKAPDAIDPESGARRCWRASAACAPQPPAVQPATPRGDQRQGRHRRGESSRGASRSRSTAIASLRSGATTRSSATSERAPRSSTPAGSSSSPGSSRATVTSRASARRSWC